ncbi:hypothetical protein TNCV_2450211 [Trichonephila clavipes]|nr:hypothetical protein TNCV_2450211 [Trichonephila clavipes]
MMPIDGCGTITMTPCRASSPLLNCQPCPVAGTSARNCTLCNLLHMVWVDTYTPAPAGNWLWISSVLEKGVSDS